MGNFRTGRINVTVVGDGAYIVSEDGEPFHIPLPDSFEDLHAWTLDLTDRELEAAVQVYYDRWMFQSGKEDDKLAFETLEAERKRRCLPNSTWAPGIFR